MVEFTLVTAAKKECVLYDEKRLIDLVHRLSLKTGNFTLASGRQASYYLDCRKLTLNGEGANLVATGMLDRMAGDLPDAVGGMAIGADPITASIITVGFQQGFDIAGFIVRRQAKSHGTGQQIEGPIRAGQSAVIVEDVVTTGGSCLDAIKIAREFGLDVDRAIAIIDRNEGAAPRFADIGVQFQSLLNIEMLGISTSGVESGA